MTGRSSCSTSSTSGSALRGDFGTTITDNQPVVEVLLRYGHATLELALYALLVAFIVGIPFGMIAAARRDRWQDAGLRVGAILFYATPVFFAGLVLKLIFSVWLGWLPASGRASVRTELALESRVEHRDLHDRRHRFRQSRVSCATCSSTRSFRRSHWDC